MIQACAIEVARIAAARIARTWYEPNLYACGFICVFGKEVTVEVEDIVPITPVEFSRG